MDRRLDGGFAAEQVSHDVKVALLQLPNAAVAICFFLLDLYRILHVALDAFKELVAQTGCRAIAADEDRKFRILGERAGRQVRAPYDDFPSVSAPEQVGLGMEDPARLQHELDLAGATALVE